MKVYSDKELQQIHRESLLYEQIDFNLSGFDAVTACQDRCCQQQYRWANFSSGISIDILDGQVYTNTNIALEHHERTYITAKFYLSGYHSVICPDLKGTVAEYTETAGHSYLFYLPNIKEIERYWAGDRLKMLKMKIGLDFLARFVSELNILPQYLSASIKDRNPPRFHSTVGKITSQMKTTIRQIWHHPYQGALKD